MRVDFYQLSETTVEAALPALAAKMREAGAKVLVVSADDAQRERISEALWAPRGSFLAHGIAGTAHDARQPILLSTTTDAPNLARNILIADGEWRDAALHFDRAFYLFDADTLDGARLAWKLLAGRDEFERHYWANEDGKWVEKG